jgi:CDGSH-type Zn-finger protein
MQILVTTNGPYVVSGKVPLEVGAIETDAHGDSVRWGKPRPIDHREKYALCRCGLSASKPFCDGTHARAGFEGTETASAEPFAAQAERFPGPELVLEDAEALCALARFCDNYGGIWENVERSNEPAVRERIVGEAQRCPSGRLVMRTRAKDAAALEPALEPSILLVEDPANECSGPLWVRGGIEIGSQSGRTYETRNRVTLCRCGASTNKPFCDGSHVEAGFKDGL